MRSVVADTSSQQAGHDAAAARRIGTAQRAISAGGRPRRGDVLLCAVRARSRFGPGLDVDSRRSQWRWLGPVRAEVMGHQRRCRDHYTVMAVTDPDTERGRGITAFVVESSDDGSLGRERQASWAGFAHARAAVRFVAASRAIGWWASRGTACGSRCGRSITPSDDRRPAVGPAGRWNSPRRMRRSASSSYRDRPVPGACSSCWPTWRWASRRPPACISAAAASELDEPSSLPCRRGRQVLRVGYRDADHHRRRPAAGRLHTPATTRSSG